MTASTTNPASHQPTAVLAALRSTLLCTTSINALAFGAGMISLACRPGPVLSERATTMNQIFGYPARDRITGFEGTVTGVAEYISGCKQLLLAGKSKEGAEAPEAWFDAQRIERLSGYPIILDNTFTPGQDRSAPIR